MSELDSLMMHHHMHQTTTGKDNNKVVIENPSVQLHSLKESYPETNQQPENFSPLTTAAPTLESATAIESDGEDINGEDVEEGVNLDLRSSSSFTPWHTSHALSFAERDHGTSSSSSTMHKTPTPPLPLSSSSSFLQWKAAQQASGASTSAHQQQRPSTIAVAQSASLSLHTPLSSSGTRAHPFNLTTTNNNNNNINNSYRSHDNNMFAAFTSSSGKGTANPNSKEEEEHRWEVFLRRVQRQVSITTGGRLFAHHHSTPISSNSSATSG